MYRPLLQRRSRRHLHRNMYLYAMFGGISLEGTTFFFALPWIPLRPLTYAIFAGVAFLQGMCRFRDFPPNASLGGFLFFTFPFQGTPPPFAGDAETPEKGTP